MKFAKSLLQRNLVPEWSQWYIDYKGLKKLVNQAVLERKKLEESGGSRAEDIAINDSITAPFFYAIDRNVEIVDNFYNSKYAEYSRRFKHVERQCALLWPQIRELEDADAEKEELIGVLLELRAHLRNLRWYAEVNKRGFTKILKKFDKKIGTQAKTQYLTSKILILGFSNGHEITDTIDAISRLYEELAPQLVDQVAASQQASSQSAAHQPPVPEYVDLLRQAIEADDVAKALDLLFEHKLTPKQLINLLLRAINMHADAVIPILVERCPFMADTADDINRRNVLHRAVIAEGRREGELATSLNNTNIEIGTGVPTSKPVFDAPPSGSASDQQRPRDSDARSSRTIQTLLDAVSRSRTVQSTTLLLTVDQQLRTPLHYAARYGLHAIAQTLLSREAAPLRFSDVDGLYPLDLVVLHKHPFTLEALLQFGPPRRPELLLTAARINAPRVCEVLIEVGGYDVNFRDPESGETALHIASKQNLVDVVRALIRHGADIEIRELTFDWTPLFLAAVDGSGAIATELLAAGARADITDNSGWTPKEHAALRGHLALAKLLPAPPDEQESLSAADNGNSGNPLEMRRTADTSVLKTFGHRYLDNEDECLVLITLGSRDLRDKFTPPVQLNTVPVSEAGKTQLDTALSLVVSATHTDSDSFSVDLPVPELGLATEPIPFYTKEPTEMQVVFDLMPTYSANSQRLARGVAKIPKQRRIQDLNAVTRTVSIVEASSLRVLGTVTYEVLVVRPFVHPNNRVGFSSTYWRSLITTRVIGHRGLGKNTQSQSSLQLGENTVESFIQAANLGASYVEFDVQLTKDNVPVIYHDFLVGDSGFDIPMHSMTFDQFMNIQRPVRSQKDRKDEKSGRNSPVNGMALQNGVASNPIVNSNGVGNRRGGSESPAAWPHLQPSDNSSQSVLSDSSRPGTKAPPLQRSRSLHNLSRGDDEDGSYDDAIRRMQYTRDFKTKGFKGNVRGMHIQSKFATLEELFRTLPQGLGFNIECKYPMLDEAEAEEMDCTIPEINHWVDTVLKVIYDHKGDRDIILSSFNPDVCILLSLKQPSLPVLFLTEGGTAEMMDIRASSLQEGIRFAKRFNMLGIVSAAEPLIMCPRLVRAVKESGLVCFTYGTDNNVPEYARRQLKAGVDAVIVDSVLAIRRELTDVAASDDVLMQEVSHAIERAELNQHSQKYAD